MKDCDLLHSNVTFLDSIRSVVLVSRLLPIPATPEGNRLSSSWYLTLKPIIIDIDALELINKYGFNSETAMDIGCQLALASTELTDEEYIELHNNTVLAVRTYCELHGISEADLDDFLVEVNEYSMK